jgi:hypothetical protein
MFVSNLDLDTVNQIISSLLFVSPTRHLLYVTDISGKFDKRRPSHKFEHLSCFLPGLLALGAHTLPLNNITTVISNSDEKDYDHLAGFDVRDLHMWAAEGLAETCYRTYADMPSGLGPDEMLFAETGSSPWMKTLKKWKSSGARGAPPGTAPVKSVIYSPEERLLGAARGHRRDYSMYSTKYMLRPEVCILTLLHQNLELIWATFRLWSRSTICGRSLAILNGANTVGTFSNR